LFRSLADVFESLQQLREVVEPVYPYSRADIRDVIGNAPAEGPQSIPPTTLLGLRVVYDSRRPRSAWASSRLAGDFAADGLLRFDVLRTLYECLGTASKDAKESIGEFGKLAAERRGDDIRMGQLRQVSGTQVNASVRV